MLWNSSVLIFSKERIQSRSPIKRATKGFLFSKAKEKYAPEAEEQLPLRVAGSLLGLTAWEFIWFPPSFLSVL